MKSLFRILKVFAFYLIFLLFSMLLGVAMFDNYYGQYYYSELSILLFVYLAYKIWKVKLRNIFKKLSLRSLLYTAFVIVFFINVEPFIIFILKKTQSSISDISQISLRDINISKFSIDEKLNIFRLVILAPVCEEIFFRGIIQSKLEEYCNSNLAIFLCTFLFLLAHSNNSYMHQYIPQ